MRGRRYSGHGVGQRDARSDPPGRRTAGHRRVHVVPADPRVASRYADRARDGTGLGDRHRRRPRCWSERLRDQTVLDERVARTHPRPSPSDRCRPARRDHRSRLAARRTCFVSGVDRRGSCRSPPTRVRTPRRVGTRRRSGGHARAAVGGGVGSPLGELDQDARHARARPAAQARERDRDRDGQGSRLPAGCSVSRRITEAIVGVTALVLLVLGLPLAIAVHRSILTSEVVELQASAARALTEVNVPLDPAQLDGITREPDAPPPFSVYTLDGNRIFGPGPAIADPATRVALSGVQASTTDHQIVVATPISDDTNEHVVGALRLTESLAETNHRSRVAWFVMAVFALAALALAWLIARRVARRLSQPVTELAAAAARIGDGPGTVERRKPSGIVEIDTLATALSDSSERVNEALARERRFSSDVSHQLRTPLTSLRLRLESARSADDRELISGALDDLDRIEGPAEPLPAFPRAARPPPPRVQLDKCPRQAADRWRARVSARGRELKITACEPIATRGSATSV